MVRSCLSNMASEYFYLKSCRKHRFPEASIYSDSSILCSYQVAWILCAIMEKKKNVFLQRSRFAVIIMITKKLNKISLHPNKPKQQKVTHLLLRTGSISLEGEWQKKSIVVLFYVQKKNTLMLNIMEWYKPASVVFEESSGPLESKRDAK